MKIYADHAATTKMSDAAINTLLCMSKEVWGNPSSLYEHGQKAKEVLEQAREDVASVINADPKEIYFTSGGSEADNQAILTAAEIGRKQGKKHIISSAFEHHAVLHTLEKLRQRDRNHPAHPGDRSGVPQEKGAVPHGRGAGSGAYPGGCPGGQYRHAFLFRP